MPTEHKAVSGASAAEVKSYAARLVALLASLRLTLLSLVFLLVAVVHVYDREGEGDATLPLVLPLSLLAINLLAAVVSNRTFRRQLPLLVFHMSLLAVIVLVAIGRMTYLRATTEVVTGGEFLGLDRIEAGPWHRGEMAALHFENLGFQIRYRPGIQRDVTVNKVRWRDESGIMQTVEIGDQVPLVLRGYRFYTSSNKGFAGVFRWEPVNGDVRLGSVIFPSYPKYRDGQATNWRLGGDDIRISLSIPERLLDPDSESLFRLPEQHHLALDFSWRVAIMRPGDHILLPSGRLSYLGLSSWMGYNVFYDWTMPWLLTACGLAVLALGWHFWRKFADKPWQPA